MRVFVYDKTQGFLTATWWFGSLLRSMRPGKDVIVDIRSWDDLVEWAKGIEPGSVKRLEYWGHGSVGTAVCNGSRIGSDVLSKVSHIMAGPEAIWWWRTCSSFRGALGRQFAARCANLLGCTVAGFTRVIWWWQADLKQTKPGATPEWDDNGGGYSWPWHDSVWCMSKGPWDV